MALAVKPALPTSFYARPVLEVAQDLLGMLLVHHVGSDTLVGRIVETEAYAGDIDESCHAYRRKTIRNASMFGPPGHAYVYRSYGMHFCINIVTTHAGGPASAVLIRGLEPVAGLDAMRVRRPGAEDDALLRGPGNLCRALGIDVAMDGQSLLGETLYISSGPPSNRPIVTTTRIGITRSKDLPWRFYLLGSPGVSRRDRRAELHVNHAASS